MLEFSYDYYIPAASVLLLISVLVSYFFYRNSLLSSWKKYMLIALKSTALFLLLMLFLHPVILSLTDGFAGKNIILLDNSRSLEVNGKNISKDFLASLSNNDLKIYTFSSAISPLNEIDSFFPSGAYTNPANSIDQLKLILNENPVNSLTIISDGNFNEGGNPLYNLRTLSCPVITVPAGDSAQAADIIVYNMAYNKTAFINTKTTVTAYIKSYMLINTDITVSIEKEGTQIESKELALKQDENLYSVSFDITEGTPGKYKYQVTAESTPGEVIAKNNYADFYIDFLDNKINLLYISGGPSYDNAVISSILRRLNNFNVTVRTLKSGNEFYEGSIDRNIYSELSAVMFLNFPSSKFTGSQLEEITENAVKLNIPFIFFAGRNTDFKKLELAVNIIPFTVSQPSSGESGISLQVLSSPANDFGLSTSTLPGMQRNFKGIIPKPGAVSLITDKNSGEPVLLTRNTGNTTSTALLGYGLWQWQMKHNSEKLTEELVEKSVRISLNRNRNKKFIITPEKEFFDFSEDVTIRAEVYDEHNNPAVNAEISAIIKDKNGTKVMEIGLNYNNGYFVNVGKIRNGDYYLEGIAVLDNSVHMNDINRFSVDSLNIEYLQTANDYSQLREIANNTGGRFTNANVLNEVIAGTENTNIQKHTGISERINLRENAHFLALIILLFAAEWIFRKRNNIP